MPFWQRFRALGPAEKIFIRPGFHTDQWNQGERRESKASWNGHDFDEIGENPTGSGSLLVRMAELIREFQIPSTVNDTQSH